ncbi:MAG: LptF/LptG family permease, partial [Desulfobulbaceae bacterium]|nr:LptF/LptG family permease [Desulfobulbaceae bacterium]
PRLLLHLNQLRNNIMPFLLLTYLTTEMLAPFFASLVILSGVLFLSKMVPFLDIVFDLGIGFADFLRLCVYMTPNLLLFSLPMTSMLAVILCFSRLSNDNEIMALKAAGIGVYRMLPSVVLFAFSVALLTGFSSTMLMPSGTVAMKKLLFQLAREKIDKGMQEKRFSDGIGDMVLYVDRIDRDSGWQGVYVSDMRNEESPVTIFAKTGRVESRPDQMTLTLYLNDGSMHRTSGETTQTISFKQYALSLFLEGPAVIGTKSATEIGKNGMTQQQLLAKAKSSGLDTSAGIDCLIEYHERLVLAVGCFMLTLISFPLGIQVRPGERPAGLPFGLLIYIFYYVLVSAAKVVSESGFLPVARAMWLPDVILALFTVYFLRITAAESSGGLFRRTIDFGYGIYGRMPWATREVDE